MGQPPERQAAAKAFMESLAQLEQTFESVESKPAESVEDLPPQSSSALPEVFEQLTPEPTPFSLSSFEDAIADLEQFLQSNQTQERL